MQVEYKASKASYPSTASTCPPGLITSGATPRRAKVRGGIDNIAELSMVAGWPSPCKGYAKVGGGNVCGCSRQTMGERVGVADAELAGTTALSAFWVPPSVL